MMELPTELAPGCIHLLHVLLERPPVAIAEIAAVLSAEERQRAARFVHRDDAHRHILGRGLARAALGRLTGRPAADIEIVTSPEGKPSMPAGPSFSIAHSGPIVLLAFAAEGRLGVDAEARRELRNMAGVARTTFCPDEVAAVSACTEEARPLAFYRVWTRKEAMLKALGSGLSALGTLSVSCAAGTDNALLRIDPPERLEEWALRSIPSHSAVEAAVAWDRPIRRLRHQHV
jgi:4'-phosphopantetheinyl transferase